MTRPCPWTVVLLVCFCSAIGARAAMTAFEKKLELLSTIIKQDNLWRRVFLESVYYKVDRTYYKHIVEDELLKNEPEPFITGEAQAATVAVDGGQETSSVAETSLSTPPDARDRIEPYKFVRNIMFKRFVVGSFLDMGLNVLMLSFKCLLYKHMVHLITLIRVEMRRKKEQKKAASWSGKSKKVIEDILMTMGALQFTDIHVLQTLSFFDLYRVKGKDMKGLVRNKYSDQLLDRSNKMLEYIKDVCVERPKDEEGKSMEEQVAEMIGVFKMDFLYKVSESFTETDDYKAMIVDSRRMLNEVFGDSPRVNGMSQVTWYDILRFQENLNENKPS